MKKIFLIVVICTLLMSLVSVSAQDDTIFKDEKISWLQSIFVEESVYESQLSDKTISNGDSLTTKIFYYTKYDNVIDYKVELSFYIPNYVGSKGILLEQGFYTYQPHKPLAKSENHAVSVTIKNSITNLYNRNKEDVCNRYIAIVGKLYVKTSDGQWHVETYNDAGTHIMEKFIFTCPEELQCNPGWTNEKKCDGDYHVRRLKVMSDCTEGWHLYDTCSTAKYEECKNGVCVADLPEPEPTPMPTPTPTPEITYYVPTWDESDCTEVNYETSYTDMSNCISDLPPPEPSKDEYGCIIGEKTWCEPKDKCLDEDTETCTTIPVDDVNKLPEEEEKDLSNDDNNLVTWWEAKDDTCYEKLGLTPPSTTFDNKEDCFDSIEEGGVTPPSVASGNDIINKLLDNPVYIILIIGGIITIIVLAVKKFGDDK